MQQPRIVEQLPIALFGGAVLAARTQDGMIHLSLRDLCQVIGIDIESQRRRIQEHDHIRLTKQRIPVGNQLREIDMIALDDLSIWLMTLQSNRVHKDVRPKLSYIQTYLAQSVREAFAALTQMPVRSSEIEDMHDITIEQVIQAIQEQQGIDRQSITSLQNELRKIHDRVRELETTTQAKLTGTQRGTIYTIVQNWGKAIAQKKTSKRDEAIRTCWRAFNARFGIATYTDLPAAKYQEAIQFVRSQYETATGTPMPEINEQDALL